MIDKPGIYTDIAAADYFADPCPHPSFTQSIGKLILERSPLHAWYAHPRLNPDYQADDDTKFDIGNVAHKMMLGRGKEIAVLEGFDDWRTKAAKEAREAAAAVGKLAVLGKHAAKADRMATAAREQLALRGLGAVFGDGGNSEVVIAWQERGGMWCRQMIDWLSTDRTMFADYKTTGESAAPHALPRKMVNDGWPIQAAMAERGLDVIDPDTAGRRRYLFVVQEDEQPHALTIAEIGEGARTMGRKMLGHAAEVWSGCLSHNRWPGYPLDIEVPQYPGWAESAWLEREITHHERLERDARQPIAADHFYGG